MKPPAHNLRPGIAADRARFAAIDAELAALMKEQEKIRTRLPAEMRTTSRTDKIKQAVCAEFGVEMADLISRRRPFHINYPRQVAMALCYDLTSLSLAEVGASFGGRDHGTVLHAYNVVRDRTEIYPNERGRYQRVREAIAK